MFHASEVFAFAQAIEKSGQAFYQAMAQNATQAEVQQLFARLAAEEAQHIQDFARLAAQAAPYDPPESYPGEYNDYMQALVDTSVFPQNLDAAALAKEIGSDRAALELAVRFEKDALLFFGVLKNLVSVTEADQLEELLRQERRHLQALHAALKER